MGDIIVVVLELYIIILKFNIDYFFYTFLTLRINAYSHNAHECIQQFSKKLLLQIRHFQTFMLFVVLSAIAEKYFRYY